MAWALINIVPVQLSYNAWEGEGNDKKIVTNDITAIPGTVCNLCEYNGTDPYTPPEDYKFEQVPDTAKVGDTGY